MLMESFRKFMPGASEFGSGLVVGAGGGIGIGIGDGEGVVDFEGFEEFFNLSNMLLSMAF